MTVLEATNLRKTFRSKKKTTEAVRGVSLSISEGEILAFLGPNGAGKTTTIKIVAGLIRPDAGEVRILGKNPLHAPALKQLGAVLEGNRNVYWQLTPLENLEYFGCIRGLPAPEARRRTAELIERFGLSEKMRAPTQSLSRGMQQKVAIAVALIHKPKLLLLDEPTLGLDVEAAMDVRRLLKEIAREGQAILLTTHQMEVAEEVSDRVAVIREGEIVAEEKTSALIEKFSGNRFNIKVESGLDEATQARLKACGAEIVDGAIIYVGGTEGLWRVLESIKPLPLVSAAKDRVDLTEVFLRIVREAKRA
ncbi:MAG: ABC transporter ATP-binding protein [Deinococcus sp.]|nr:ABC transporter ATP-binding protein [Deinococcus sp.]MCL5965194.1 ABC transporter ATP-binding protein [Deinococcus sp.]